MKRIFIIIIITSISQLLPAQFIGKLPRLIPYRVNHIWGYADSAGKIRVPPKFDEPVIFEDMGIVSITGKKGILDSTGRLLVNCEYDEINTLYDEGFVVYARKDKQYYQFLRDIKTLIPYDFPKQHINQEIDPNEQIEPIIEEVYYYPPDSNIHIRVSSPGQFDIAVKKVVPYNDGTSKLIGIDSVRIEAADIRSIPSTDSLFLVKRKNKWGVISFTKKMTIESIYDSVYSVAGALAFGVKRGKKTGIVMPGRNLSSPLIYDEVRNNADAEGFLVRINNRWEALLEDLTTRIPLGPALFSKHLTNSAIKLIGIVGTNGRFLGYIDFYGRKYWQ